MYSEERKAEIIRILDENGKVSVEELADKYQTSRETIRRDLKDLEAKGALTRTHGGAVPRKVYDEINGAVIQEYPQQIRGVRNPEEKERICRKAASFIRDNDTVFIDNSTTCLYIVQNLPPEMHVTILTNSLRLLTEAAQYDCANKTFHCLGGSFNPRNLSTYNDSMLLKDQFEFFPNKCILSCAGISESRKITDGSIFEVATKQMFMEKSTEVFLLADHTKFGYEGQFFLDDGSNVDYLITDREPNENPLDERAQLIIAE